MVCICFVCVSLQVLVAAVVEDDDEEAAKQKRKQNTVIPVDRIDRNNNTHVKLVHCIEVCYQKYVIWNTAVVWEWEARLMLAY